MPPTEDLIDEATANISRINVRSFTADPPALAPGTSATTIRWDVQKPPLPGLQVRLNGTPVPNQGSRTFAQAETATYRLTGHSLGVSATLRQLTVAYDTSRCFEGVLSEGEVRALFEQQIQAIIADSAMLSLRRDPQIEVTAQGVTCSIRINRAIDSFPDLKVNLDLVLVPTVENGQPVVRYRSFTIDTDWPWWVTALSHGVTKIVEEVIDEKVEGQLKPGILASVRQAILELASSAPNFRLHAITLRTDEIEVRVCPSA